MITNPFYVEVMVGQQVCLVLLVFLFSFCQPLNCDPVELEGVWRFDSDSSKRNLLIFGIVFVNSSCLEGDWLGGGLLLWAMAWLPGMYLLQ